MITLPFAVGKFAFDLAWDSYRRSHNIRILGDEGTEEEEESGERPSHEQQEQAEDSSSPEGSPFSSTIIGSHSGTLQSAYKTDPHSLSLAAEAKTPSIFRDLHARLSDRFPTFMTALPRLPFALVPFAFSQFILIEALNHQGWVNIWANWLVRASQNQVHPTIWLIGVLGVILCNLSGTNIGATILLTKVVRAAALSYEVDRAAGIALAVASNIGAVSFTFSASLAGLLWQAILKQKGITVKQRQFAFWNLLPILVMTAVGLGIVSAEMAVLFPSGS